MIKLAVISNSFKLEIIKLISINEKNRINQLINQIKKIINLANPVDFIDLFFKLWIIKWINNNKNKMIKLAVISNSFKLEIIKLLSINKN